jgi:hypothetical protein
MTAPSQSVQPFAQSPDELAFDEVQPLVGVGDDQNALLAPAGFLDRFEAPCVRLVVASIGSETGGNNEVRKWQDTDK